MNATVARLTARSLLGRRRALLLLLLPAVLLALSGVARALAGTEEDLAVGLLGGFALGTLVPLLGLIAGTGAIGPEIDDGSIVYVLAKPLDRHSIVVTKLLVAVAVVTALGAVPTFAAGVLLTGTAGTLAVAFGLAAAVAGIAYCALFVLLAVVTRNAVVVGLLYALVWETLIGQFVPGAQALSIQQWALAIADEVVGSRAGQLGVTSAVGLPAGVVLLLAVTLGATWYAGRRLRTIRLTSEV
ncbi:ABC transporter permease subunit [Geodermatophilus sabuli]|uniref:ABC transporter permease subunit n=1 Tax=Geodermatophilus sabuli TaxID=1564158 RepID=A0A7K3W249_9ACTN|nr:ABC transporter permease subunit [Geodermatophilus sabuli]